MNYTHRPTATLQNARDRRAGTTLFVVHTTGSTSVIKGFPGKPGMEAGRNPNFVLADHYDDQGADGPHELITWEGAEWKSPDGRMTNLGLGGAPDSWQIADPADAAPHAGIGGQALQLYAAGLKTWTRWLYEDHDKDGDKELIEYGSPRDRYKCWTQAWPGLQSPLDLLPAGVKNPNECSYAWELVQPVARTAKGWRTLPFTARQVDVLAWRGATKMREFRVPYDPGTIRQIWVGHGDLHPLARYASYGEWDPCGRGDGYPGAGGLLFDWEAFFARLDHWARHFQLLAQAPQ